MSLLMKVPGLARARRALERRACAAWQVDRARLTGLAAIANRTLRVTVMVIRGVIMHRLEVLAAALTYYTVFAMVPKGT